MVDRLTRRIVLKQVKERNKKTLEPILRKRVRRHSIIYSDGWKAYCSLGNFFYKYATVNHSKEFVNKVNGIHINTIEGNWSGSRSTYHLDAEQNL